MILESKLKCKVGDIIKSIIEFEMDNHKNDEIATFMIIGICTFEEYKEDLKEESYYNEIYPNPDYPYYYRISVD